MSAYADTLKAGFIEARNTFGVDFTVAGDATIYRGVQLGTDDLLDLGGGGFMQDYKGGLEYLPEEVTITVGDLVTIESITYRVTKSHTNTDDPVRKLFLIGKDK